ncbi:MAG: hypothetical protein ABIK96_01490 [bacterium]
MIEYLTPWNPLGKKSSEIQVNNKSGEIMQGPVGVSDYYEAFPPRSHNPGDIWNSLPTFGTLLSEFLPSLIITPACDLSNRKVETLTYLPILSVAKFFESRAVLRDVLRETQNLLNSLNLSIDLFAQDISSLRPDDIVFGNDLLDEKISLNKLSTNSQLNTIHRCRAGFQLANAIVEGSSLNDPVNLYRTLVGEKPYFNTIQSIVRNSFRTDLHFLPGDDQKPEYSAVPVPSVVMFRYPLTIPIDILDSASVCTDSAWEGEKLRLSKQYSCAKILNRLPPIKALRVRPRFVSDLLTRFIGLYGRIGSPDFTEATVRKYAQQIGGN